MNLPKPTILCTRKVSDDVLSEAAEAGLEVDMIPFIHTEIIDSVEVHEELRLLLTETVTVVFTSPVAVEAVARLMSEVRPVWELYCIGQKTRELAEEVFGAASIMGSADTAAELAEEIMIAGDVEGVFFLCGNQRREELPTVLRENGIEVTELIVYTTGLLPVKLRKNYHGILFFSPSAVESFFRDNKPGEGTILFAIGNTTAAAIRQRTANRLVIASTPDKNELLRTAMEYFVSQR